jgi:hypothetical protein
MNQQSPDAQITLAWVLYQLARNSEAEQVLRNAQQLGNPSPDSTYLVAKIFAEQNRGDAAKTLLTAAFDNEAPGIFVYRKDAKALLDSLK